MTRWFSVFLLFAAVALTGCGSSDPGELTNEDMAAYSSVPMENVVLLETDSSRSLSDIAASLPGYQDAFVNAICVSPPRSFRPEQLKALVDSCHQAGINFFVHASDPDAATAAWLKRYNVDGFHCPAANSKPVEYWELKIDSLSELKPVLMIAHNATEQLKWAGFSSSSDDGFTNKLAEVMTKDLPVSQLDTTVTGEKLFFTRSFPALRFLPNGTTENKAATEAAQLATFSQPGAPFITETQLNQHGDFIKTFLNLYTSSPVLQYGDCVVYDGGTGDVFIVLREFQGKKILFAINLRDKPATYKWPENLMGIKTELLMGEKITRNGGQELSPYGYQVLGFENIVGMDALEMDNK